MRNPGGPGDGGAPRSGAAHAEAVADGSGQDTGVASSEPGPDGSAGSVPAPRRVLGRGRRLFSWRPRSSRFEPGPLGLLGVMLAAMAVTLLFLQPGFAGPGAAGDEEGGEPVTVPGPPEGQVRVMVVGDSLSQGSSGDYTWRYHLWSHLRDDEVEVDFVGPFDGMYGLAEEEFGNQDYADPDFDTDHAARWGTTAQEMGTDTARVAAEYEPHYVLLMAGIEDILAGDGADLALEGVGETVSTVRVVRGQTRFVLGELPSVEGTEDDDRINAEIDRFNMGVVDLAEQLTSEESPVVVARVADGYAPAHDNWDEVHPNTRGELKIAAAFADALADPLGVGRAYQRPLPTLSVGPTTAPDPVAEETGDGLVLSWDAVPGATDYRIVQRRVEPDPDEATVLPVDVRADGETRSALVEALLSGARYEFVVRAFKGRDQGAESEALRWVWDEEPPPGASWVRVVDGGAVVEWEEVAEASHYEVWVRALECSAADDRRAPGDTADGDGPSTGPTDEESATDAPSAPPQSPPTSRPRPSPEAAEPPPSVSHPRSGCEPRDGRGPGDGEGWRSLGPVGEQPRWSVTVSAGHEVVVRSHRDYVAGGDSHSVSLTGA